MSVITNKWNDGSGDSINIESPSFQGNQTVKISSPIQKGTSKRSMKFIGKCKKDSSKQVILTVEQEASTYTYDLTLNSDNTEIAAKGGTATITAVLKTYRNGNLVSTDNVTPVLSGSATGFSISGTTVTASNRTTTAGNKRAIVVTGKYSNTFDGQTVSSTITIYQEANIASYGALEGGSLSASDIPASGGTSSTNVTNMSQTISYTSGSTRAGTVTYSKTSEITVSSLGTTVKARTKVGQVTVTYTGEGGATANKTVDIYQAENKVTNSNYNPRITAYGTPTISIGSGLTAAGGSATVSASVTNTETYNALYSSGAIGPNQTRSVGGSLSISMTVNGNSRFSLSGNTITHSNMGTNETTDTITIKAVNDGDSSKSATASKSITNSKTVKSTSGGIYKYGYVTSGTVTNGIIPASGGSATATAGNGTQNWSKSATITTYQYDSGSTKDVTTENALTGTNNVSPGIASIEATASSKETTVSSQTTIKSQPVIWSANGKSAGATMYIYQEANIASYGALEGGSLSASDIPASGGTSSTNVTNMSQTISYTSGSTRAGTVTYSKTSEITVSSLGTTVKARTKVGQVTVTYTGEGGATANKTVDIYQAENKVTNSNYNPRITAYGTPTISIGSGLTAAGGSATVSASVTNTETYNALYSSGAIGPNQTRSVGGSLSISMTVNGNSRFSLSGNTITHSNMGTNETTDTITIKAVNDGDSSKSATASKSITNSKTVKSTSGGIYKYGYVTSGTVTNGIIPASGGSATATAGNGTQNWSKSATITTYQYDSGSTKDVTTENALTGTNNVSPGIASIEATASSKETTVSSQTTIKSQPVIWSANGKSAGATMYIYQEANKIESYHYSKWSIDITANPTTIAASGGTSTIYARCTRLKTPVYTSGSMGTITIESATPMLAISGTGFTLSGTTVIASKNNGGARSCTVTASEEGAISQTVTITQSAGPDGIDYMQIEGDGKSHPIFRVGDTTRSIEPTSVNQNSDITSDKDSSIFASLKQLLFKFI